MLNRSSKKLIVLLNEKSSVYSVEYKEEYLGNAIYLISTYFPPSKLTSSFVP